MAHEIIPVQVTHDEDRFLITSATPSAESRLPALGGARWATVSVTGGTISLDVVNTPTELEVELYSLRDAAWWIDEVFGAGALAELTRAEEAGTASFSATWPRGDGYATLVRLLFGIWMRDFAPGDRNGAQLDEASERWLDVEVAVEAWRAENALGDLALPGALFAGTALELEARLRTSVLAPPDDTERDFLLLAAGAFLDSANADEQEYEAIADALASLEGVSTRVEASAVSRSSYELVAGDDTAGLSVPLVSEPPPGRVVASGRVLRDWRHVHPRVFTTPSNHEWILRESADGESSVEVSVVANAAALSVDRQVFVRVFAGGLEVATVHLDSARDEVGEHVLVGSAALPAFVDPESVVVEAASSDRLRLLVDHPTPPEQSESANSAIAQFFQERRSTTSGGSMPPEPLAPFEFES